MASFLEGVARRIKICNTVLLLSVKFCNWSAIFIVSARLIDQNSDQNGLIYPYLARMLGVDCNAYA